MRQHVYMMIGHCFLMPGKGAIPLRFVTMSQAFKVDNIIPTSAKIIDFAEKVAAAESMCPELKTDEDVQKFLALPEIHTKVIGQFSQEAKHSDLHAFRTLRLHNVVYEEDQDHAIKTAYACVFNQAVAKRNNIEWDAVTMFGKGKGQKAVLLGEGKEFAKITTTSELGQWVMSTGQKWQEELSRPGATTGAHYEL